MVQYLSHSQSQTVSSKDASWRPHCLASCSRQCYQMPSGIGMLESKSTRSTQRAQTSLAEADHYSHISRCKNVEPWLWKTTHLPLKKKMVLNYYLHHDLGMLPLLRCFFAHLLILQYPDHHQNLSSSSLYYSGPAIKFHPNPFITFWVMLSTDKQTDKQTDRQISSSLYYSGPAHKISSQSVHNSLSNVVHRQTDRQTNQRYQKT